MLNICNAEMNYLDLKFNTSKCHMLRIGKIMAMSVVRFVLGTRLLILSILFCV